MLLIFVYMAVSIEIYYSEYSFECVHEARAYVDGNKKNESRPRIILFPSALLLLFSCSK